MNPARVLVVIAFLLLVFTSTIFAQQRFSLTGKVADAESGERLIAANIRISGTARGTITNANGEYRLLLEAATHVFVFSSLAYQPETLKITITGDTVWDIRLRQSPIQIPEVVIVAEDPAIEIIRKAIANKRAWMDKLRTYRFDAFTRQVLRRDTAIASITESYSTGFMASGDTLREIIRQKRQTENISLDENFASVGRIVNFNDDDISLFRASGGGTTASYTFVGPTAPDALENYDYKLLSISTVSGVDVYTIRMKPKSRLKPLFDGTIIIADRTFAVIGVDLKPNETLVIPFVKDIGLRYIQKFSLYDSLYWMPTDIRIMGTFSISIIGFSLPRIGFEQISSISDYAVNVAIPDSVLRQPRLRIDSSASKFDSTFWQSNVVLPLTKEEQSAYHTLDSTQTIDKQFEPKGPLATLTGDAATGLFSIMDARYNRVEGFYFGAHMQFDSLINHLSLRASAGYGFSDDQPKFNAAATWYPSSKKVLGVGGDVYHSLDHAPDGDYYGTFPLSLFALIDKNDYRDYFFATGWQVRAEFNPTRQLSALLSFVNEQEYSMANTSDYSLFAREKSFRINPTIADGRMRSLQLDIRFGPEAIPFDFLSRNAVELSVEHSSPSVTAGEFDFTRYSGNLQWNIATFARRLFFPPTLRVNLAGGTSTGTLPPQRIFTIDSRIGIFAPFGVVRGAEIKEFTGDRFVVLNVEHNFRNVPFLLLDIPSLYSSGIEVILHGSTGQSWLGSTSTSAGWYYEAGFGVSRILDLIRMDLNYRFSAPSHLNFTITAATLF